MWLRERLRPSTWQVTLFWAALAGFLGALAALVFQLLTHAVHDALTGSSLGIVASMRQLPWWLTLVIPAIGAAIAGLVLWLGSRYVQIEDAPDYMEAMVIGRGELPLRASVIKSLAATFVIASGGSVGREGPMVQLSAVTASLFGRWRRLAPEQRTLLIACGASAGIATAYNAPIAGSFFIAEIVLGTIATEALGPLVVSAVCSALTLRLLISPGHLYEVTAFHMASAWEMLLFTALGLLVGVLAPWFRRSLQAAHRLFKATRLPRTARLATGGLIVGALAIHVPEVTGNGYAVVLSILQGDLIWSMLLLVLVCKWLATSASVGSGAPGGVLTPSLFVGASTGYLFGIGVHQIWPLAASDPSSYALVGMGAFLAAAVQAPVMTVLLLFEMTLNYDILLPLMLACVVAYFTAKSIEDASIYSEVLRRKREVAPVAPSLASGVVADVMNDDPIMVRASTPLEELARLFLSNRVGNVYVVDDDGGFLGGVSLHDIKPHLTGEELEQLVVAYDVMHTEYPTVTPDTSLTEAIAAFVHWTGERIPVVDSNSGRLRGSISKRDLLLVVGKWTASAQR